MVNGLVALLVLANVINIGADLNAMGDSVALVVGGFPWIYTVAFGVVSLLLQIYLPYDKYVRVLKWLTLSLLAYVGVAFAAHVDWMEAVRRTVLPSIQWSKEYVTTVVAILGTTISPYLFFWQAAQEVEEIKRVAPDKPLRKAPDQAPSQIRRLHIDTVVGMGFSNLIAFFMIVATAATLNANGTDQHRDDRAGGRSVEADRRAICVSPLRSWNRRHRLAGVACPCRFCSLRSGQPVQTEKRSGPATGCRKSRSTGSWRRQWRSGLRSACLV
jgi:Mn2+/Fe2+ NRAMP family transporter